jgi:hypothetical protein
LRTNRTRIGETRGETSQNLRLASGKITKKTVKVAHESDTNRRNAWRNKRKFAISKRKKLLKTTKNYARIGVAHGKIKRRFGIYVWIWLTKLLKKVQNAVFYPNYKIKRLKNVAE